MLSHLFTKAVEWGWLDNKNVHIRRYKEERVRITYLTVDQIDRLLAAAKQDLNHHIYLFILIGLEAAMRRSEILSIQLENIDLERHLIYIPNAKAGPREQPITISLGEYLRDHLKQLPSDQLWLFPAKKSNRRTYNVY